MLEAIDIDMISINYYCVMCEVLWLNMTVFCNIIQAMILMMKVDYD